MSSAAGSTAGMGSFGSYGSPNMGSAGYQGGLLGEQSATGNWLSDKLKSKGGQEAIAGLGKALMQDQQQPLPSAPSADMGNVNAGGTLAKLLPYVAPQFVMPLLDLIQKASKKG